MHRLASRLIPLLLVLGVEHAWAAVELQDLVHVTGSTSSRVELIWAAEPWRHGIRSYAAVESEEMMHKFEADPRNVGKVQFGWYPDVEGKTFMVGDTRWALAPFTAAEEVFKYDFKW